MLLLVSGMFKCMYMIGLEKAYQSAELSLVYPLAWVLPVLVVPAFIIVIYGKSGLSNTHIISLTLIETGA